MIVKINDIVMAGGKISVSFSTRCGAANAIWNGCAPNVGVEYDVELEVGDEFLWGKNASLSLENTSSLKAIEGSFNLTAKLVSVDSNGNAVVDVSGSILLLELAGYRGSVPVFVDFKFDELTVFPTGI